MSGRADAERPVGGLSRPALAEVVSFARSRLAEGIGVQDLADHAGYSPFHFSRLFRSAARIPPGQYLTALRIDAAKKLLLTETIAVVDVATAVGFDSQSSFSRRFRDTVGVAPGRFRALADTLSTAPLPTFRIGDQGQPRVEVRLDLPDRWRPGPRVQIWLGWFPTPAPIGLPAAGVLAEGAGSLALPLCPGHPWLLALAVSGTADPEDYLLPRRPLVGFHPAPLCAPAQVTVRIAPAEELEVPLLCVLPSLAGAPG